MLLQSPTPRIRPPLVSRRSRKAIYLSRGRAFWLILCILFTGIASSVSNVPSALAAGSPPKPDTVLGRHTMPVPRNPRHVKSDPTGTDAVCSSCGTPPLVYKGGPVQYHPRVYLVFWGSKWQTDTDQVIPAMQILFQELGGGAYNNILEQYTDSSTDPNAYVHNDVVLAGTWIDPLAVPTITAVNQVMNEAGRAVRTQNWQNSFDTQVLVFPQQGTVYDPQFNGECGEHDYGTDIGETTLVFAMIRYSSDWNCNWGGGTTGNMTKIAAHEYAEAATDPEIHVSDAWRANDGGEVGDLCNDNTFSYRPVDYGFTIFTQELWNNHAYFANSNDGCDQAEGTEYASPPSGKHTVHGLILDKYTSLGANTGVIGPPVSEEMPIGASGHVSYFTGGCGSNYPTGNCAAIYWSPASGTHYVRGSEYQKYVQFGEATGVLGFPVTDDTPVSNGSVTYFAATPCNGGGPNGSSSGIYWSPTTGSHEVHGCIYHEYAANQNGAAGRLGFPVSDEYTNSSGNRESDFQGGNIQWINGVAYAQFSPHCVTPTAVYGRTGGNWNLLWYGNNDPTGGSWSWASGTGNTVGTSWDGTVFSGGNGIIYRIDSNNNLWWYKHLGASNGSFGWQGGKQIGNGWGFSYVFSGGNGIIYAVDSAGNLHWYDHLGFLTGTSTWASGSGAIIGSGWGFSSTGISYAFSGGNGVIYAVYSDGSLRWYRHLGYLSGQSTWATGNGRIVSTGWGSANSIIHAFSAGGGIIFVVHSDGTLYWYDHLGFLSGLSSWANSGAGKQIGVGWDSLLGTFADVDACQ